MISKTISTAGLLIVGVIVIGTIAGPEPSFAAGLAAFAWGFSIPLIVRSVHK